MRRGCGPGSCIVVAVPVHGVGWWELGTHVVGADVGTSDLVVLHHLVNWSGPAITEGRAVEDEMEELLDFVVAKRHKPSSTSNWSFPTLLVPQAYFRKEPRREGVQG